MCVFVRLAMDIDAAKNQCESFKSAVTSDDSLITTSEGLIAMEEMDHVEDYPLLECTAPSEGQTLPAVTAKQSNVLHFGHEEEGIGGCWISEENDYSLLDCITPLQGQTLHAVNVGQSNSRSKKGGSYTPTSSIVGGSNMSFSNNI